MANGKSSPGGGPGSRALGKPTTYFTGQPSQRVNPGGAGQLGQTLGNHSTGNSKTLRNPATPMYGGSFGGPGSTKLGNETALRAGQGPGAGREVSRCGSQQGVSPAPAREGKDILGDYGMDSPNAADRLRRRGV